MKPVIRWIVFGLWGWLVVVRGNQQLHTACRTLHTIHNSKLDIKCNNTNDIVYVRKQLSINSLGENFNFTVMRDGECQNTSSSTCFLSMASDIPSAHTSKISLYCNGKHSCALEKSVLKPFADKFTTLCRCCIHHLYKIRIGVFFECLPSKSQVSVGKNITETRDGSLYLTSLESGRCLIRGSIESARILEQVNIRFTVSDGKSRLCTEVLTNGSFNYNKDLSCLRGLDVFLLDIQTMDTWPSKLWMEFKGTSMQLDCGNNIQFPSVVREVQDPEQNGASTLLPIIIGLVAGLLLLLVLILVILKRKHALTIKAEAKHCTINATTTLEGDEDCTYYNNEVDKARNDANDAHVQGTSSTFDDSLYNTIDTGGNYSQINIKKNTSESGGRSGEQNVKNGEDDTEKSRDESRDTNNVTTRSSNTTEIKPNTIIGEVTGDVYAAVCKTDDLKSMRITGPKGDIYATVSMASNVE